MEGVAKVLGPWLRPKALTAVAQNVASTRVDPIFMVAAFTEKNGKRVSSTPIVLYSLDTRTLVLPVF